MLRPAIFCGQSRDTPGLAAYFRCNFSTSCGQNRHVRETQIELVTDEVRVVVDIDLARKTQWRVVNSAHLDAAIECARNDTEQAVHRPVVAQVLVGCGHFGIAPRRSMTYADDVAVANADDRLRWRVAMAFAELVVAVLIARKCGGLPSRARRVELRICQRGADEQQTGNTGAAAQESKRRRSGHGPSPRGRSYARTRALRCRSSHRAVSRACFRTSVRSRPRARTPPTTARARAALREPYSASIATPRRQTAAILDHNAASYRAAATRFRVSQIIAAATSRPRSIQPTDFSQWSVGMTNAPTGKNDAKKNSATTAPWPCSAATLANTPNATSSSAVTTLMPASVVSPAAGTQSA